MLILCQYIGDGSTTAYTIPEDLTNSGFGLMIDVGGVLVNYTYTSSVLATLAEAPAKHAIITLLKTKERSVIRQAVDDAGGGGGGGLDEAAVQDLIDTSTAGLALASDLTTLNNAYNDYTVSNDASVGGLVDMTGDPEGWVGYGSIGEAIADLKSRIITLENA